MSYSFNLYNYSPYWNCPENIAGQRSFPMQYSQATATTRPLPPPLKKSPLPTDSSNESSLKKPSPSSLSENWLKAGLNGVKAFLSASAVGVVLAIAMQNGPSILSELKDMKKIYSNPWKRVLASLARLYVPLMLTAFGLGVTSELPKKPMRNRLESGLDQTLKDIPIYLAGILSALGMERMLLPVKERLSPRLLFALGAGLGLPFSLARGAYAFGKNPDEFSFEECMDMAKSVSAAAKPKH